MSEAAAHNLTALPSGWLPLDRAGWWGAFAATPLNGVLVAILPLNLGSLVAQSLDIAVLNPPTINDPAPVLIA